MPEGEKNGMPVVIDAHNLPSHGLNRVSICQKLGGASGTPSTPGTPGSGIPGAEWCWQGGTHYTPGQLDGDQLCNSDTTAH